MRNTNRALIHKHVVGDTVHVLKPTGEIQGQGKILRVNIMSLSYVIQMAGDTEGAAVIRGADEVRAL